MTQWWLMQSTGWGWWEHPRAGEVILQWISGQPAQCPPQTLQNALLNCYRAHASLLLGRALKSDDAIRPILARVLAEIAGARMSGDILALAADPLAEVRASAARVLALVRPHYALHALARLAGDDEWFVRLRAVVAIGDLGERRGVPLLILALCDSNRFVRLRAATSLIRFRGEEERILQLAMQTGDHYALQVLVSEMERSGRIPELVNTLGRCDSSTGDRVGIADGLAGRIDAHSQRPSVEPSFPARSDQAGAPSGRIRRTYAAATAGGSGASTGHAAAEAGIVLDHRSAAGNDRVRTGTSYSGGRMIGFLLFSSYALLLYYAASNIVYLILLIASIVATIRQQRRVSHLRLDWLRNSVLAPPISILVPARNEQMSIVESVRSLLALDYPELEVIVVNDGSTDSTLDVLRHHFHLMRTDIIHVSEIPTRPVRAVYASAADCSSWCWTRSGVAARQIS